LYKRIRLGVCEMRTESSESENPSNLIRVMPA